MSRRALAFVASSASSAQEALARLRDLYDDVPTASADVVVVLGGDGFLLHALHELHDSNRPFFGMNRGTVGFLLNEFRVEDLVGRIEAAVEIPLYPLSVEAVTPEGESVRALAFNEAAITRHSGQSVNLRVAVDDKERLPRFVGDGMIVATPAGSTAYNLSAHGPIIPLGSKLLALTPVSPFRPRRWRGALLPHTSEVVLTNLDLDKRPVIVSADFCELGVVQSVKIREDRQTCVRLLFDRDRSLEERVLTEQFLPG
ncbi:MAG: inorganic polyphosphate kinase [Gemmatimonas sp. SG8_38_2]|nr:MAG: inorganic polyphosphate kinase [Gemmatimonas sp. SG8_38_2]